ncbi:CLUMA_CG015118, isoform A [Clunio marinus]|uniref:non-specific serine/threonine protein kinase n=1 Tax=Clunio marinus TaxID=568069 RepID=A0A1J1IQT7_9DIPT|nr:CLUMA_CG015118, isoform A [Clunio marinus]
MSNLNNHNNNKSELEKLSEESLTRQPEEVFDVICKLGEGSYGSVYKAKHKESDQIVAIKQVPVDTDLQEIIKEISIMQQCDSPYVVKYYGSYFKNTDLWIIMEYCGAGSVSDIMRLRKKTLTEDEISTILSDTLKGLEYLHLRRKIHRDIKAGNILLNSEGHAKLADFGVAGQLTDTMAKRNTVIGTPFWMAPEPPPSFREIDRWSPEFIEFVSLCLVKNPDERASATSLLKHEFVLNARPNSILSHMIAEAKEIRENQSYSRPSVILQVNKQLQNQMEESDDEQNNGISKEFPDCKTLVPFKDDEGELTMIAHTDCNTLIPDTGTMVELQSNLGTMVINSDSEELTMKRHDTNPDKPKYRPLFLEHFDKKEAESCILSGGNSNFMNEEKEILQEVPKMKVPAKNNSQQVQLLLQNAPPPAMVGLEESPQLHDQYLQARLDFHLNQIQQSAIQPNIIHKVPVTTSSLMPESNENIQNLNQQNFQKQQAENLIKFQRLNTLESEYEFLKFLSYEELEQRLASLDKEMDKEFEETKKRYKVKRKPIIEAIEAKQQKRKQKIEEF